MLRRIFLLAGLGLLTSACGVYAPPTQAGSGTSAHHAAVASGSLSAADIGLIQAYYADASPAYGKGQNGRLPPGIAKNLQRGKPLPPGIAKQHLPSELLIQLPPAGEGLEYVIVAGKLLLVEIATQIFREILIDSVFD